MDNDLQPLDNNTPRSEKITKLATSILSAFGPVGSVVSTIVNESISAAHQQRIVDFLSELYFLFKQQNEAIEDVQHERLFKVISSLSEYELIMLIGYSKPRFIGEESEFDKEFEDILMPRSRTMGSPESDVIFNAFYDQYMISLEQKSLLIRKPEIKENNLKFSLKYTPPAITIMGELVVDAIYDEDFFLKNVDKISGE